MYIVYIICASLLHGTDTHHHMQLLMSKGMSYIAYMHWISHHSTMSCIICIIYVLHNLCVNKGQDVAHVTKWCLHLLSLKHWEHHSGISILWASELQTPLLYGQLVGVRTHCPLTVYKLDFELRSSLYSVLWI